MHSVRGVSLYIKVVRLIFISNINSINIKKINIRKIYVIPMSTPVIGQVWEQLLGQLQRRELRE